MKRIRPLIELRDEDYQQLLTVCEIRKIKPGKLLAGLLEGSLHTGMYEDCLDGQDLSAAVQL